MRLAMQQRILRDRQYAVTPALTPPPRAHPRGPLTIFAPQMNTTSRTRPSSSSSSRRPSDEGRTRRTVAHTLTFWVAHGMTGGTLQRRYVTRNVDFLTGNLRL